MRDDDLKRVFRDLLKASKWTQAEAARQLAMTPGALSQIVRVNSTVRPSQGTLRLFRLLLEQMSGQTNKADCFALIEKWEVDLIVSLRQIPLPVRLPLLKAFTTLIEANLPVEKKAGKKQKSIGDRQ